jgi:hypothetical protein
MIHSCYTSTPISSFQYLLQCTNLCTAPTVPDFCISGTADIFPTLSNFLPPQSSRTVQGTIFWLKQRVLTTRISFQIHLGQWLLVQLLSNASSLKFCYPACPHKRKAWDTSTLPYVEAEERLQEHLRALPQHRRMMLHHALGPTSLV